MTTPLDAGHDPDRPREWRALESYPEFFAYPTDPDARETTVIPRVADGAEPLYQKPYTLGDPPRPTGSAFPAGAAETAQSPAPEAIHPSTAASRPNPDTYIKDKLSVDAQLFSRPPAQTQRPLSTLPQSPHASHPPQSQPSQPSMEPVQLLQSTQSPHSPHQTVPVHPPKPAPRPPHPRAPGRRRAKRSLAASLWPFQAFRRPTPQSHPQRSTRIRSRSTTATVWRKLKADRAATLGAITIGALILLAVFAPVITAVFSVDPNQIHPDLTDTTFGPHGSLGGISWSHPLGVDQHLGRDIMARLLYGARVSLLIAFGATLLSVGLGTALGVWSGYVGGRVDSLLMRTADLFLAFPLMLFALALTGALSDQAFGLSGNALRIGVMIFVMGFFNWPYIARIVRAEVLSLREREFVDAARAMGASTRWILWRELMPNLMAPILVYATLLIPANIIFEAGLSALGIGLDPPTASWGQMMTDAVATVYTDPEYLIVPGMAVFITVLAFNLFGDGLRNATDPTAQ